MRGRAPYLRASAGCPGAFSGLGRRRYWGCGKPQAVKVALGSVHPMVEPVAEGTVLVVVPLTEQVHDVDCVLQLKA